MRFLFLVLLLLPLGISGRNIYIIYDDNCMDRLEYTYQTSEGEGTYVTYHINLNSEERIVLEVGKESENFQNYIPTNFWRCDNANFNFDLIQSINRNVDEIFLVLKQGRRKYSITPVRFASYFNYTGDLIQYYSPKYRFEFDLRDGIIGENIAFEDPTAEVYFEGRLDNDCSGAYIFRQYSESYNSPPHTDLILAPEIGIVEERSGRNVEDAFNNMLSLTKINGTPVKKYLRKLCGKPVEEEEPMAGEPTEEDSDVPTQFEDEPDAASASAESMVSTGSDFHIVKKGETLFRIAEKHNVSLTQMQMWNDIPNVNLIYPGDRIMVRAPQEIIAARGGDDFPAPYEDTGSYRTPSGYEPDRYVPSFDDTHVVKPGETVASIAMKYGYTEERFREINDLKPNQFVRIGQRLKTSDCNCPENPGAEGAPNNYEYFEDRDRANYENPRLRRSTPASTPINKNVPTFYDAPSENRRQPDPEPTLVYPRAYDDVPQGYDISSQRYYPDRSVNRKAHVVQEGETIYSIARKYKMTAKQLRELNNLELTEVVIPYQKLYLE